MTTQANSTPGTHPTAVQYWLKLLCQNRTSWKKGLLFLVLVTFTLTLASAQVGESILAPAENLLANAGFETGDLTGWSWTTVPDGDVTNTEANAGTYSMEMHAVDVIFQRFHPVDNLHAKSLRLWAKSNNVATGPAYATVYYLDRTSDQLSFGGALLSSTWTQFILNLTPRKVVTKFEIAMGEGDPIFVDDVQLRRFTP
jgi:hypothetical protein